MRILLPILLIPQLAFGGMQFEWVSGAAPTFSNFVISPPSLPSGGDWTFTGWIKPDGNTRSYQSIMNVSSAIGIWWHPAAGNNSVDFYFSSADHNSTLVCVPTVWCHFALVIQNTTLTWYINGVFSNSGTYNAAGLSFVNIGNDTSSEAFFGNMADFRLYSRALTFQEIQTLALSQIRLPCPIKDRCISYWPMDDGKPGTGGIIVDHSGNNDNGIPGANNPPLYVYDPLSYP